VGWNWKNSVGDLGAGAIRRGRRPPVASGVGADLKSCRGAPGSEDQKTAGELQLRVGAAVQGLDAFQDAFVDEHPAGEAVLQDGDAGHPGQAAQRELEVGAGGVAAGVEDAGDAVRSLATEGDLAVESVEGHAATRSDAVGGLSVRTRRPDVDEPGAGSDGPGVAGDRLADGRR
jgi:hypothetical protein